MNLIRGENQTLLNPNNISYIEVNSGSLGNGRVHAVAVMVDGQRVGLHSNLSVDELEKRLFAAGLTIMPRE